jgi:hypothetical protein
MLKRLFFFVIIVSLLFIASIALAKPELSFYLAKKDGSDQSDGVTVIVSVEEENDDVTEVFNEHWEDLMWSDQFVVDLREWAGESVTINMTTSPGPARNTGWDWILIGDAKITDGGNVILDIGQAVASGQVKLSMLLDGDKQETEGLGFGANCTPDVGPAGGENKPTSFMQHPPWDGRVGNTIARYEIQLAAVEAADKLSTKWGQLKKF